MQRKFWRYFFDILLLLSLHRVFPAPLLVANTSSGFGSGIDMYFKIIAKPNEFFLKYLWEHTECSQQQMKDWVPDSLVY